MGFDDDHSETRKNRSFAFINGLIGAVIGAGIVVSINHTSSTQDRQTALSVSSQPAIEKKEVSVSVNSDTTKAVEKTHNAIVGINNIQSANLWSFSNGADEEAGSGSGVIYKKSGNDAFIVTNNHVVEGAKKLEVSFADGSKVPATLLGTDVWTDLAVLKIDSKNVKDVAEFGDSDALKLGEPVMAIGNPLGNTFSGSVTEGIISGLKRSIPVDINDDGAEDWETDVLQTDAAINPGNSGGALININGQVVGINSMKIAEEAVEGIGLSIPINSAKPIIADLEQYGMVKRPYMGVDFKSVSDIALNSQKNTLKLPTNVNYGIAIRQVDPGSPAASAGLRALDVIVELDGAKINDSIDFRKYLYEKKKIGDSVTVKFYRNGKINETKVILGSNDNQP